MSCETFIGGLITEVARGLLLKRVVKLEHELAKDFCFILSNVKEVDNRGLAVVSSLMNTNLTTSQEKANLLIAFFKDRTVSYCAREGC